MGKNILIIFILMIFLLSSFFIFFNKNSVECLSFTFDDGYKSHYDLAYHLLKKYNFSATFFVIANTTYFQNRINYNQIKEMYENGYEIGSHSINHSFLKDFSDYDLEYDLIKSKKLIESFGIEVTSYAIPYVSYDERVLKKVNEHYLFARDNYNKNNLAEVIFIEKDVNVSNLCQDILNAKNNKKWIILVIHNISPTPSSYGVKVNMFNQIVDCVNKSGIYVDNFRNCNYKLNGN